MATCRVGFCERNVAIKRAQLCNAHYLQQRAGKPFGPIRFSRAGPSGSKPCAVEGCDKTNNASRGMCHKHYWRQRKFGDAGIPVLRERKVPGKPAPECLITGCENPRKVRDWCQPHYNQWNRNPASLGEPIKVYGKTTARDASGNKHCRTCGEWKPEQAFASSSGKVDGLQARCRECSARIYRGRAEIVRDKMREQRFGINRQAFDLLLSSQGGACAICLSPEPGGSYWCVDHDHACCPSSDKTCGQCVRGILCGRCNSGIGHLRDDIAILQASIDYLTQHSRGPSVRAL